jgi:hypothetical protein
MGSSRLIRSGLVVGEVHRTGGTVQEPSSPCVSISSFLARWIAAGSPGSPETLSA